MGADQSAMLERAQDGAVMARLAITLDKQGQDDAHISTSERIIKEVWHRARLKADSNGHPVDLCRLLRVDIIST